MAKRISLIVSLRAGAGEDVSNAERVGDAVGGLRVRDEFGRHLRTASTEARQGCTWRG